MADTTEVYNTDKEPATAHDVAEGGAIGLVGGAIVGGLAGGPIGAVVGAVLGGAASAGAVDVVDKHDHDYARTASGVYHNSVDDVDDEDEDLAASPTAYREDTTYATTAPAVSEYAGTTALRNDTSYDNASAARTSGDDVVIPVVEEELAVGKRTEQTGGARIHTEVIETPVQESVNLREEHVTIDRHAVDRAATDADFNTGARDITITETREVPVVAKEARVVEEVVVGKTATERAETISDTVRRTDVVVDDVDGKKY